MSEDKGARFKAWPKLDKKVQRMGLGERRREIEDRTNYAAYVLEQMRAAVRDLFELALETSSEVVAHLTQLREMIQQELYEAEEATYRDIATAAYALASVEYLISQSRDVMPGNVRELIEERLKGLFLFESEGGTIRYFGKTYCLRDRLQTLPVAQQALDDLRRLFGISLRNERQEEERQIAEWHKSLSDGSGITLDELLAGKVGRCEVGVATERPKDGSVHKGGRLFWDGDGEHVWIAAVFQGMAGYVARRGLHEFKVPISVLAGSEFKMNTKNRDLRNRTRQVWDLMQRCIRSGASATADGVHNQTKGRKIRRSRKSAPAVEAVEGTTAVEVVEVEPLVQVGDLSIVPEAEPNV